jgi:hypothetical protein
MRAEHRASRLVGRLTKYNTLTGNTWGVLSPVFTRNHPPGTSRSEGAERGAASVRISTLICTIIFIACMLAMKFFVAPAIVSNYGIVGVIAFVSSLLALGYWWEKKENLPPKVEPPKSPESNWQTWAQKTHDDPRRPRNEEIIDAEFTVIEPLARPGENASPANQRHLFATLIVVGCVIGLIYFIFGIRAPSVTDNLESKLTIESNGLTPGTNAFLRSLKDGKTYAK